MPRKVVPKIPDRPYHIWSRSNNKEWFSVDPDICWSIFCTFLNYASHAYGLRVHAFVLMSNHYHLLASTTHTDLPTIMNRFHTEVSRAINDEAERINHVFGGRYKSSIITSPNHYERVLKYIYQNPVRANMTDKAEKYKFSTCSGLYGFSKLLINVDRSYETACGISDDITEFLGLINECLNEENLNLTRKGLRKAEFKLPVVSSTRRSHNADATQK